MRADNSSVSLSRRERPHLVFDGEGLPVALTNGVTEAWPCGHPEVCPRDHCYTALQALNQGDRGTDGKQCPVPGQSPGSYCDLDAPDECPSSCPCAACWLSDPACGC